MRAILLPGMDGSGELLSDFAAALAPEFEASVIAYPPDVVMDYAALREHVRAALPTDEPFVLIAESFSGPIAIELAAEQPPGLAGLVLSNSFATRPRAAGGWRSWLVGRMPHARVPAWLYSRWLLGRWSSRSWRRRLRAAVAPLARDVLRQRLRDVRQVDVLDQISLVPCPLLVLRATHDRLVARDSWLAMRDRSRHAVCIEIDGPHLLLQAQPQACADAIKQ